MIDDTCSYFLMSLLTYFWSNTSTHNSNSPLHDAHCPIVRSAEKHKTYTLKWERKTRRALHKTTLLCMKQAF